MLRTITNSRLGLLLLIFLLALGLRLGFFVLVRAGPLGNGDSPAYEDLAQKLLHRESYLTTRSGGPGGFPTDLQRPPGYPLFLSLKDSFLGYSRTSTAWLQCVLSAALTVVLVIFVGRIATPFAAILAGGLYASDWVTIVHVPLTISETFFVVVLGIAVCLFAIALKELRPGLALSAGILLGFAALVKPLGQLVLAAFLVAWIGQEKRRKAILLFILGYAICVTPWMTRNYFRHGLFTLSEIGTVDLYFYTAESSLHPQLFFDLANSELNNEVTQLSNSWSRQPLTPAERKYNMERETLQVVRRNWPIVTLQAARGLGRTCFGTGFITATNSLPRPPAGWVKGALAVVPEIQVLTLWLLAILGACKGVLWKGSNKPLRLLLLTSVALLLLPTASSMGQSRFRVPAVPLLCVLGAMGGDFLWQRYGPVLRNSLLTGSRENQNSICRSEIRRAD